MNSMPKHVATTMRHELGWNATPLSGDVPAAVTELKKGDGGSILVAGSSTLVRTLLAHGLVDELRLMVFPIAIGGGLRTRGPGKDRPGADRPGALRQRCPAPGLPARIRELI